MDVDGYISKANQKLTHRNYKKLNKHLKKLKNTRATIPVNC